MSNEFVHSITVPRIYKLTADVVRRVREDGASLKTLIFEKKHPNVAGIYGLSVNTLRALPQIDQLLDQTQILTEQPRLNPWLARVLITELLWRKGCLKSNAKPILTVLAYEKKLRELKHLNSIGTPDVYKKQVQKPRYVRVNTLILSVEKAISIFQNDGWQLLPKSTTYSSYLQSLSQLSKPHFIQDLHIPEILVFPPSTHFYKHSGYLNGEFILQDKASCLPVHLLNPVGGSVVLDMCAAPGMKTSYVAAKLQNNGKVYAVEIDNNRFQILISQIKKTKSFCVEPLNQDALSLNPDQYSHVEYILVDPTCSGSGIVDRPEHSDTDSIPKSKRLQNLHSFQAYLLRYALFNFPNVKKIIYSTCSLHPEENEEVIDEVLGDVGNAYRLIPVRQLLKENWVNFSSTKYNCGDACLYARPNDDFCNGFFVAVFERNFDVILPKCNLKGGNEYKPFIKNIEKNDMAKTAVHNREKYKKTKKKRRNKQKKMSTDTNEFTIFEIESKGKVKSKKNETEIGKTNVCNSLSSNYDNKLVMNESKGVQEEILAEVKVKKSKHETAYQIKTNNSMLKINSDNEKQNTESKTDSPKIKKKKKRINKKVIGTDQLNFSKRKQNEETIIVPSKKSKKE
ncbi:hypothetical protein PUN28_015059 [Cardiocondyla obscurior]